MMPHDWPLVSQQPEIAKECDSDMAVMKFTAQKSNELFDVLYGNGIFLPPGESVRGGSAAVLVCEPLMQMVLCGLVILISKSWIPSNGTMAFSAYT